MRALPFVLASLLAALALPATAHATDGWCVRMACVQTCTAHEEVCVDPEACMSGDPQRMAACVDATQECLHVGPRCGPPE